jgi:D-apiose dehydrogenase
MDGEVTGGDFQTAGRMKDLNFAVFGAGFWSQYQLAAWQELKGARCVAIYNRTLEKAKRLADRFGVPAVYDDPGALLNRERLDFIDIITDVSTHGQFVTMAAERGLPSITQKPMAPSLKEARQLVELCRRRKASLFVHENWRWQHPMRELKAALNTGSVGAPFRARIDMISGFPVFRNQPFLAELEQFIITDLGAHMLDLARFLFGEAVRLYCETRQVHKNIKGEDAATITMRMGQDVIVTVNMAYAENFLERDRFPETFVFVEGEKGSIELAPDFWLRVTTKKGTHARRVPPPHYPWADPAYDVVHASGVPCNANLLSALRGEGKAETTGEDNLRTLELVYGSYESAAKGKVLHLAKGALA